MKNIKKIFSVFSGQFRASLGNSRVLAGYLIGILFALKNIYAYNGYAAGRVIHIFEPYLENFISVFDITVALIGFLLIMSDAPFIDHRSTMILYRTGRNQWFWGMSLYMIAHGLIYYLLPGILGCIYSMKNGYLDNIWSRPMRNLVTFPSKEAIQHWHLQSPVKNVLSSASPVEAMIHTLLLVLLYSLILTMVMFLFNAAFSKAVGTGAVALIHLVGYVMAFGGFSGYCPEWSLLGNVMYLSESVFNFNIWRSYTYCLLILCVLFFVGPLLIKRADFKHTTGERNE